MMDTKYFLDMEVPLIEKEFAQWGVTSFRVNQVINWVYQKKAESFLSCSDLPKDLRERLENTYKLRSLQIKSKEKSKLDGTIRYNFVTHDGFTVPAVFLPSRDRNSVCISSQIGCPIGCVFCASGKVKFKRNLSRGEILDQIIQVEKDSGHKVTGVLFMGMGEPLLNYNNVVSSLRAIVDFKLLGLGRRHVTVSTSGLIPGIRKLAEEKIGVRLALSLHASDDEVRQKLIPETNSYKVKEILEAGLYYSRKNNSRLTIEYILIPEVNDTLIFAQKFVKLINKTINSKDKIQVNLIPCNTIKNLKWQSPEIISIQKFRNYLDKNSILAIVRHPKGVDIGSACGQLGV